MKTKQKTRKSPSSINPLLKIAERIATESRKADNRVNWREKLVERIREIAQGKDKVSACLRLVQTQRDAGQLKDDDAFRMLFGSAESLAYEMRDQDSTSKALLEKLWAIEERFKMDEDGPSEGDKGFDEWKKVWDQLWSRHDQNIAAILREYGEGDIADFFSNDRAAFDKRINAGAFFPDGEPMGRALAGRQVFETLKFMESRFGKEGAKS